MKVFCESIRLLFREIVAEDLHDLYELDADPEVHKFLGNRPVRELSDTEKIIHSIREQYQKYGIARWAVIEKETKEFIGWAGLKFVTDKVNGHSDYYDLGLRFKKRYWGRGFGTECARASLKYGFENLNLKVIYAAAQIENLGSNKALRNAGFNFVEVFSYADARHNWYELTRENWLNKDLQTIDS